MAYKVFENGKVAINDTNLNETQDLIHEDINGEMIYGNTTNSNSGSNSEITLTKTIKNTDRVKIFFKTDNYDTYSSVEILNANNKAVSLTATRASGSYPYIFLADIRINENKITWGRNAGFYFMNNSAIENQNTKLLITHVIRYSKK